MKIIVTIFLIMLGSIAIFAQRNDGDYKGRGENFTVDIERQCYDSTNSFAEFKRCVERQHLPLCSRGREFGRIDRHLPFPCRKEREDYWEKRHPNPRELRDHRDIDRKEIIYSRQLPNEKPEIFNQ